MPTKISAFPTLRIPQPAAATLSEWIRENHHAIREPDRITYLADALAVYDSSFEEDPAAFVRLGRGIVAINDGYPMDALLETDNFKGCGIPGGLLYLWVHATVNRNPRWFDETLRTLIALMRQIAAG